MSNNFIYINTNSLKETLCKQIIERFEKEDEKEDKKTYPGVTSSGVNSNIKHTVDFKIDYHPDWVRIRKTLENELKFNLTKYMKDVLGEFAILDCKLLPNDLFFETFQIQRYRENEGKFVYHHDESIERNENRTRVLTYIWYLNDVEVGGETEINATTRIKPETGKLLLFPASWTYPHCGIMPVSNDKYIITGWVFKGI